MEGGKRDWLTVSQGDYGASVAKKLELRLGPPGDWPLEGEHEPNSTVKDGFSLDSPPKPPMNGMTTTTAGAKRGFVDTETGGVSSNSNAVQKLPAGVLFSSPWSSSCSSAFQKVQHQKPSFPQFQVPSLPAMGKESSPTSGTKVLVQSLEKTPCTSTCATGHSASNSIQPRTSSTPVVGWPPIRSFRKNLASSSSKTTPESQKEVPKASEKLPEKPCTKGFFVKINMDGMPIGRKVDLKAQDSYEKLSNAVDKLFKGLLAAQRDSNSGGNQKNVEESPAITGLLDGTGEYTLVYEDNEGDMMLVGDVPWGMFVATVKRLRVLKSSELPALSLGNTKPEKAPGACGAR